MQRDETTARERAQTIKAGELRRYHKKIHEVKSISRFWYDGAVLGGTVWTDLSGPDGYDLLIFAARCTNPIDIDIEVWREYRRAIEGLEHVA